MTRSTTLPDLTGIEATDVEIGDVETVDIGPFGIGPFGTAYVRVAAADLVAAVDQVRRLLDDVETAVLDARQEARDALRVPCPVCGDLLDPYDECDRLSCVDWYV